MAQNRKWIRSSTSTIIELVSWRYAKEIMRRENNTNSIDIVKEQFKTKLIQNLPLKKFNFFKSDYDRWFQPSLPGKTLKSTYFIEKSEELLIKDILKNIKLGRFHPLLNEQLKYANESTHLVSTSLSTHWSNLDKMFTQKVIKYNDYDNKMIKNLPSHAVVFHRGVGLHEYRAFFYGDKMNESLVRFVDYFKKPLRKIFSKTYKTGYKLLKQVSNRIELNEIKIEKEFDPILENANKSRQTLQEMSFSFTNLIKRITLIEPTYKEVFVMYRTISNNTSYSIQDGAISYQNEKNYLKQQSLSNTSNIHLYYFKDIPMADINIVLPFQRAYLRYSDKIFFGFTGLLVASTSLPLLEFSLETLIYSKTWITALIASSLTSLRLVSRMLASYLYYEAQIGQVFGEKLLAKEFAAISALEEVALEQLSKEVILVYYVFNISTKDILTVEEITLKCASLVSEICLETKSFDPIAALNYLVDKDIIAFNLGKYSINE